MFPFADMMNFLAYELTGLRRWRLSLALVFLRALEDHIAQIPSRLVEGVPDTVFPVDAKEGLNNSFSA